MTTVLGISAYYHDSAACLLADGEILAAAQEERFTRKRHDPSFPRQAIAWCLRQGGIRADQLDHVVYYDKPLRKFERLLETYLETAPRGLTSFLRAMPPWLKEKLWMREEIARGLGYAGRVLFTEHHEAHAASAFFPSPFERAALLTVDGVGEWATASYGAGRDEQLDLMAEMHFPHSLGLLYSAFTSYLGFKVNSGEYKVMGLAPYGTARYVNLILEQLLDLREDGSLHLNLHYFDFCEGLQMTNRRFHALFGGPQRKPESPVTQRDMDLARSIQDVTELAMVRMARHVRRETGEKNLCMAGGVALNCVANAKVLRESGFERIWIQPAAGDAGGALGAALSVWHQYLEKPRHSRGDGRDRMDGALLGPEFSPQEIARALEGYAGPVRRCSPGELIQETAKRLAEGKVAGWFQGRMEFGPRALGARSILGDPRSPQMQSRMNLKIKFRESFRPFAPAVAEERSSEFFDLATESPYMLMVAPVADAMRVAVSPEDQERTGLDQQHVTRSLLPAVTHVDGSARVETVRRADQPLFHALIAEFGRITGFPVLVNTSFNVRGEPIVCTPADALKCFERTNIDVLALGPFLIEKDVPHDREVIEREVEFQLD